MVYCFEIVVGFKLKKFPFTWDKLKILHCDAFILRILINELRYLERVLNKKSYIKSDLNLNNKQFRLLLFYSMLIIVYIFIYHY